MKKRKRKTRQLDLKLPKNITIDELRDRRDLAIADGDNRLALACAREIDRMRGY